MDELSANDPHQLVETLRKIDISVSPRTEGRTTFETERWSICRWVASLAVDDRLEFPFTLTHSDRPDFCLCMGDRQIGVEVTEAISEDLARAEALAAREKPDALIDLGYFKPNDQRKTNAELRSIIADEDLGGGEFAGDAVEGNWARYVSDRYEKKERKSQEPGFERHPENWLLVYDNTPSIGLREEGALDFLVQTLAEVDLDSSFFDIIAVERPTKYLVWRRGGAKEVLRLSNLWQGI